MGKGTCIKRKACRLLLVRIAPIMTIDQLRVQARGTILSTFDNPHTNEVSMSTLVWLVPLRIANNRSE